MNYNKKQRRKYYLHTQLKGIVQVLSRKKTILVNHLKQDELRENKYFCELMSKEYGYEAQTSIV